MKYANTVVRQALSDARKAGRDVTGLGVGQRATELQLEKWGHLPPDPEAADAAVAAWYRKHNLVMSEPGPADPVATGAALAAAEAALEAAAAALRAARAFGAQGMGPAAMSHRGSAPAARLTGEE